VFNAGKEIEAMKRLTLHRSASSLYRFIASVAQLCPSVVHVRSQTIPNEPRLPENITDNLCTTVPFSQLINFSSVGNTYQMMFIMSFRQSRGPGTFCFKSDPICTNFV
jgi:hypothetical protein